MISLSSPCISPKGRKYKGYLMYTKEYKSTTLHRYLYEQKYGKLPKNIHVDHLCKNRGCINLKHLEAVSIATNVLRGNGITAQNINKQQCIHGHKFDKKNTYLYIRKTGHIRRVCRACQVVRVSCYYRRQTND